MAEKPRPAFPAPALPEAPGDQKLLGIYEQRQEGFLLQRIRIPGGRLTPVQWLAIADAAENVGARDALHLTTRQCLEVHGLTAETVPVLQGLLGEAGLSTVGAAGDTVRNFTVDAEAGLVAGVWDLMPLAEAITAAVEAIPGVWGLPRKFKVALSGSGDASMRPWMSDIGLIAAPNGTLAAIVAGSLGAKSGTGIPFADGLTAEEAVALSVAAVRLHAAEGDRENRRTARLRHVRERMGDAAFLDCLRALHAKEITARAESGVEPVVLETPADACSGGASPSGVAATHLRLAVPHGDLPLRVLRDLIAVVAAASAEVRIGIEHDLYVFGLAPEALPAATASWRNAGRLVACPGTALCSKAAAPTHEAADTLASLAAEHPGRLIAISGCPNSCAHATIASIGLIGRMKRVGEERVLHYAIHVGGDEGTGPALARPVGEPVALEELRDVVAGLLGELGG